ncbi:MAG TPA: protein phosphatase 2C domain-containing protein [Streptosporangiaceae bacterium]|nr:protein phosphatase 2C domain-containing protein [Streptosporangiaceae bacterium]
MNTALIYAAGSDVGRHRENNEDSAYAGAHLLAVADGMGGYAGGEVASSTVIGELRSFDAKVPATDLSRTLGDAVANAHAALCRAVDAHPDLGRMGTTLTAMLWSDAQVALAHIGDSRCYLLRGGELSRLTDDHTMDQLLGEGSGVPQLSHVLFRVLDGRQDRTPDLTTRTAEVGDRYLLCSDGLTDAVTDAAIGEVLAAASSPADAVHRLIDIANAAGGPDNVTCVVADLAAADAAAAFGSAPPRPVTVGAAAT